MSVPGSIPNWFGAPAVKWDSEMLSIFFILLCAKIAIISIQDSADNIPFRLEPAEKDLFDAPVCKNKGGVTFGDHEQQQKA